VKTGGFDTVFNENSKRKTFNAISFIEKERLMGDNAYSQVPHMHVTHGRCNDEMTTSFLGNSLH